MFQFLKNFTPHPKYSLIKNYILFCVVTFLILPITTYYFNAENLSWELGYWLLTAFLLSFSGGIVVAIILRFYPKISSCFNAIFISLALYFLIRNFFLSVDFGVLKGTEKVIPIPMYSDFTFFSSIIIFCVLLGLYFYKKKFTETLLHITCIGGILFCGFVFWNTHQTIEKKSYQKSNFNRFSKTENIIVISMDAIQNNFLQEVFIEHPELKDIFDGFTFYTNIISYAPNTTFSLMSTLSGKHISVGKNGNHIDFLKEKYFHDSLLYNLNKKGYKTDAFGVPSTVTKFPFITTIDDVLPESYIRRVLNVYSISILRVLPKSLSWRIIEKLENSNKMDDQLAKINKDKDAYGIGLHWYAFQKLYQNAYLVNKPVFKFHHYLFTHPPIRFNEKCVYDINAPQNSDSAKAGIVCALSEFKNFLDKLKEMKIYDKSMIILTSDHGYPGNVQVSAAGQEDEIAELRGAVADPDLAASRYWPILLVKNQNQKGEMQVNQDFVELIDIPSTIYQVTHNEYLCKKCDGKSLIGKQLDKNAHKNMVMFYDGGKENYKNAWVDTTLFNNAEVYKTARMGIYHAMESFYLKKTITCDKKISFNTDLSGILTQNISGIEEWGRWSDGKKAKILFYIDTKNCSQHKIKVSLIGMVNEKVPIQHVAVSLNGVHIGNIEINTAFKSKKFIFSYPLTLVKEKKVNILEFQIKHPILMGEKDNQRRLGIGFESIVFE